MERQIPRRSAFSRYPIGLGLLVALCLGAPAASAQEDPPLEGRTIEALEFTAPPRESLPELEGLSELAAGQPYRASDVRRAVKVLYQLGRFENVFVRAGPTPGGVRLQVIITPRPFVREITVLGADTMSDAEVIAALQLKRGAGLDIDSFPARRALLVEALRREGHRSPAIGLAVRARDQNGGAEVVVRVSEGPLTRLRRFVIRGDPRRPFWKLASTFGISPGDVIDLETIESALDQLKASYRRESYLEVSIGKPEVRPVASDPDRPMADVVLTINSGPKVLVRFKGKTIVPDWELTEVVGLLQELGIGRAALDEVRERVLSAYERRGYWRARVTAAVRMTPDGSKKEILFSILEGQQAKVREIVFVGNDNFDEELLRAKVAQIVEESLSVEGEFDRPSADPQIVAAMMGDRSEAEPRATPQPHAVSPDPYTTYLKNAYKTAAGEIADLYRADGYQSVQVAEPTVTLRPDGVSLEVRFEIVQGVRWNLEVVSFTGNRISTALDLLEASRISPGEPMSFYKLEAARRALQSMYQDQGYLYARVDQDLREVLPRGEMGRTEFARGQNVLQACALAEAQGKDECDVELVFRVHEGPQVTARRIVIKGAETTSEALIRGEITVEENQVLRASEMRRTQFNLARLGLFSRISVRPLDEEQESPDKDLLVELKERKQWAFEIGAGASTEEGVRLFGRLSWSNVGGTGIRAQLDARVSTQPFVIFYSSEIRDAIADFYRERPIEYAIGTGLTFPTVLGLPRGVTMGMDFSLVRDNEPAFGEDAVGFRFTAAYTELRPEVLGKERPVIVQLRGFVDRSQVECNEALPGYEQFCGLNSGDIGRSETLVSYIGGGPTAGWDFRDDRFNPREGVYLEVQPHFLAGLNEASPNHLRLESKINAYMPLLFRTTLALSFIYQHLFDLENRGEPIPINRRVFSGGQSTIRGYQERTLFPQDVVLCAAGEAPPPGAACRDSSERVSPGGLLAFAFKTELRFPITAGLTGTLFYDWGDLFNDPNNFFISFVERADGGQTRQGAGVGIRYDTPIGPLILDIAVPLVSRGDPNEVSWTPHFAVVGTF